MNIQTLRKKHPQLIYQNFSYKFVKNQLQIEFDFLLKPSIKFKPTLTIEGINEDDLAAIDPKILDKLIFHLGLAEIPSYWKASCSPQIIIQAGQLNPDQIAWWKDLIIKGLGEFFYQNQIDFTAQDFIKIKAEASKNRKKTEITAQSSQTVTGSASNKISEVQKTQKQIKATGFKARKKYLIPAAGGKDSSLTLGIFDKHKLKYGCLLLHPQSPASGTAIQKSHCQETIKINRRIDQKLLDLNRQGYLNGHTPYSAYLAFLSSVLAYISAYQYVVLANERSANEENLIFHGQQINHQYSKTFDFETKFRDYAKRYLFQNDLLGSGQGGSKEINLIRNRNLPSHPLYFSFLRPVYELQIAKLFAAYPQYHPSFRSCNVGQRSNHWCHHCPKCLFVFTILFPFVDKKELCNDIFSENLFEKAELLDIAWELIGFGTQKPFECVGTHEETLIAFYLSVKKYEQSSEPLPIVLKAVKNKILAQEKNLEKRTSKVLKSWNNKHYLPADLAKILKQELLEAEMLASAKLK
ncbi:MAG: hypothetical protein PVJ09_00165 [Candidatus Woesebacteria bacterium]|jgi:hypothetical protein